MNVNLASEITKNLSKKLALLFNLAKAKPLHRVHRSSDPHQNSDHYHYKGTTCSLSELIHLQEMAKALLAEHSSKFPQGLSGDYISSYKGHGMEYHESRLYQYGDDVKNMDWRVTARTQKPFVKTYRDEKERPVFFLVDHTNSMHFATRNEFKSVKASKIAAVMAWAAANNSDKVGGLVFNSTSHTEISPTTGNKGALELIQNLTLDKPVEELHYSGGGASLRDSLFRLKFLIRKGSRVYILSDFNKIDDSFDELFFELSRRGEINLILIFDPIEKTPLPQGHYRLSDGENKITLDNVNEVSRNKVSDLFDERLAYIDRLVKKYRMKIITVSTEDNLKNVMKKQLGSVF